MVERREYPRFRMGEKKMFSQCPHCPGLGPIIDISLGGLSFFFEGKTLPAAEGTIDIYFGNDLFCIRDIPCEKIYIEDRASETEKRGDVACGRILFGSLNSKQLAQLSYLIQLNCADLLELYYC
ncbi:MAG: hypothetical protein AB1568_14115 [Thermodesulfobacteriota bacterium]